MSDLVTTVMDAMEGVEVWVGWGDGVGDDDGSYGTLDRDSRRDLAKRVTAALLADPAAHAAMLDALVSAGVLRREVQSVPITELGDRWAPRTRAEAEAVAAEFPPVDCDSDDDCCAGIARISDEVRYVTEWEELPRAQDRLSAESEASQ